MVFVLVQTGTVSQKTDSKHRNMREENKLYSAISKFPPAAANAPESMHESGAEAGFRGCKDPQFTGRQLPLTPLSGSCLRSGRKF